MWREWPPCAHFRFASVIDSCQPADAPAATKPVPPPPKKAPTSGDADGPRKSSKGGNAGNGDEDSLELALKKFRDGGDEDVEDLDALYLQMQDEKKRRNTAVEDLDKLHKELTVKNF